MKKKFSTEAKVGVFVLVTIAILAYITIDVSQLGFTPGGTYKIYTIMDNAEGVSKKTPVQVAGIPVGVVSDVELTPDKKARVEIELRKDVKIGQDVQAEVRTRGVLGDTYIEIFPGTPGLPAIGEGGTISRVKEPADYQQLVRDLSTLTGDLKEITSALKTYTVSEKSYTAEILKNMQTLTKNLADFSTDNAQNMNTIVVNLRGLSSDLRSLYANTSGDIETSLNRISQIAQKVDSGQGTIGRLINDPSTIKKTNEALDNINELTGGFRRMEAELSYHLEYLGTTGDVKNYFSFKLSPGPDKFFRFGVVYDPNPPPTKSTQVTTVTTGSGATSVIETETQDFDKVRFTAELGKKWREFTVHGGLIESTGGVGIDYDRGPVSLQFSAFDFTNGPHLKFLTQLNLLRSLFVVGGVDDFLNRDHAPDWFLGAGVRFTDEDIKSLIGGAAAFAP
ncbi:MAG TPA: hypothetical protein DF383_09870 [Deltaproteobacteria bacterium]|nr:hypothetical protein [Deltaproteobacteria bacterium]